MQTPILATKLYLPPPRPNIVARPRLTERLNQGLHTMPRITLVSAPAGFGKTTLLSAWIAGCNQLVAWLSLDAGDNDPSRFLAYLVAALQKVSPALGAAASAALQSSQPPPAEWILTGLLNEIAALSHGFILVLDDYHVIDAVPVDLALAFLVERLPPQMHLVIATRADPPLPLARLRASGQLVALRAADLRFTPAEAADFLNRVMGLRLSAADITALETRTEGWIAGLQLASLSMQGRDNTAGFIQSFTGSHRFVLDYLVEEVLQRQPERVRDFLLQTSILERCCASLCDAVTGREDGKAMLTALERASLFVIPLDDRRKWVRYHHLFAETLQTHLLEQQPEQVAALHLRASLWFEQNDLPADAIRHALAARKLDRAADLIERAWLAMDISYQSATWMSWVQALPESMVRARPVVSFGIGWALLHAGELEASEVRLRDAERWLKPSGEMGGPAPVGMVVADETQFRALPAAIAAARAYRSLALGDILSAKQYARQALALVQEDDALRRTQATALLGLAEYTAGNLPAAEQELLKFQALMWQANDIANAIGITFVLANIKLVQGRLNETIHAYRRSLELAAARGVPAFLGASDLHRGLSELLCEQGDLQAAAESLQTARRLGEQGALTGWPHRLCAAEARLCEARGELDRALALLQQAEREYVRNPLPDRSIPAMKARTWLLMGRLDEALVWMHEQNLSPGDEISFAGEFEHLTLARLLIARYRAERAVGDLGAALDLLARLLQDSEQGGRNGSVIEMLTLQSRALQAQSDTPGALAARGRALAVAEPQGYERIFVNEVVDKLPGEGEGLRGLIETISRDHYHPHRAYASKLVAAFAQPDAAQATPARDPSDARRGSLIEPLSERELVVLRLLRSELSGPEIAERLIVSLNTLRTHTKNIFHKLGVSNRRAAVRRGEELGLF